MNKKIAVFRIVVGDLGANCYVIYNQDTKEALCVDPGGEAPKIYEALQTKGLHLAGILLTHSHYDHIYGVDELKHLAGAELPVYIGADEQELLANADLNLSSMFGKRFILDADVLLKDMETLELLGTKFQALHTPGHTQGGVTYYFPDNDMIFSGDTLFEGSIGRSDFPTGDFNILSESIRKKLYTLPLNTIVYPGHGESTTIRQEKDSNPFVRG